jgi:hypothetical protein
MKTDELIAALATGVEPVDRQVPRRAFGAALGGGLLIAFAGLLWVSGLNPELRDFLAEPMFWVKLGFGLLLAASSLWLALRLARPGARAAAAGWAPLAPIAVLWLLALAALAGASAETRAALLWGSTWTTCLISIPLLSAPTLVGALLALRRMAPTCPGCAGAAAGALAAGVGVAVYTLHCPELAAPFLAVWYVAGAAIPVVVGALLGRLVLRW